MKLILICALQILWGLLAILLILTPPWINSFFVVLVVSIGPPVGAIVALWRGEDDWYDELEAQLLQEDQTLHEGKQQ